MTIHTSRAGALQYEIDGLKKAIELRDKILKLADNPEFKSVIREEFCVNTCATYAQESADPVLTENQRKDALGMAQAAGHLRRWLSISIQQGNTAASSLEEYESELVEARNIED